MAETATTLRALPAARIIGFLADCAERWADADFAPRVRVTAALRERLGYTEPVVDYALDRLFFGITRASLAAAIASELGTVAALDGPVARSGAPAAWAYAAGQVAIVSSDTTIGVALPALLFALAAKNRVTVKDRNDALVGAFLATLAQEHPVFATAAHARAWDGGDDPDEAALFGRADVVVAYGRDEALRAIRAHCGVETRFVPYGHRASIGWLDADAAAALDALGAETLVRDALLYDGEGCLSLHALFADVRGAAFERLARLLAAACERVAIDFPAGTLSPARDAAAGSARALAAFRAAGGRGAVYRGGDATLLAGAPDDEPPTFAPRVLALRTADADGVAAYCARHALPVQALGVADPAAPGALALAERIGAVRVARFGTLQDPPLAGHHGGLARIADFVRWIDLA